ncbi:MAG: hypothetical protein ACW96U_06910 [Candidatus Heimdallarchaeaceae archaeon]|jgi:hypothetical protein
MSIRKLKKKQILVVVILLSFSIAIASIMIQVYEKKTIDTINSTEGIFAYSTNLNTPFLYYEVRVETGEITNFYEILLNSSLPIPSDWGVDVTVYDDKNEEIRGNRIMTYSLINAQQEI